MTKEFDVLVSMLKKRYGEVNCEATGRGYVVRIGEERYLVVKDDETLEFEGEPIRLKIPEAIKLLDCSEPEEDLTDSSQE